VQITVQVTVLSAQMLQRLGQYRLWCNSSHSLTCHRL